MSARDQIGEPQDPPDEREVLKDEIAQAREELGETVEALVNKADVKAHLQEKVQDTKEELRHVQQDATAQVAGAARRPMTYWAIAGVAAGLLVIGLLRGR